VSPARATSGIAYYLRVLRVVGVIEFKAKYAGAALASSFRGIAFPEGRASRSVYGAWLRNLSSKACPERAHRSHSSSLIPEPHGASVGQGARGWEGGGRRDSRESSSSTRVGAWRSRRGGSRTRSASS